MLNQFVSSTTCIDLPESFAQFEQIFGDNFQENLDPEIFVDLPCIFAIDEHVGSYTIPCEVSPRKFLHINASLDESQQEKLLQILKSQTGAFA